MSLRLPAAIALTMALTAGAPFPAGAREDAWRPRIGPVAYGMSEDEVRAATPGVAWTREAHGRGAAATLHANRAFTLAGMIFEASLKLDEGGVSDMTVDSWPVAETADVCEERALALATLLDRTAGPFQALYQFPIEVENETILSAGRSRLRSGLGKGNNIFLARDPYLKGAPDLAYTRGWRPFTGRDGRMTVVFQSDFHGQEDKDSRCRLRVEVEAAPRDEVVT